MGLPAQVVVGLSPRSKLHTLGAACLLTLVLPAACTENPPSRVIQEGHAGKAGAGASGKGGAGGTGGSTGGTAGTDAGPGPDACLPERCAGDPACVPTPEEQLTVDICRRYEKHCPDQPADVMMERSPGEMIPAGPEVASTAERPQLTEDQAELYTVETALRSGGIYRATYTGTGEGSGAGGEGGATGSAGAGGEGGATGDPFGERTVTYTAVDDWEPRGPIEDPSKIVPGIVVDPSGDNLTDGTFQSVQKAINMAVLIQGCPRVFVKVLPGTYREKITVPAKTSTPPVTLYGVDRDPSQVVIVAGNSAAGDEMMGIELTIHASATFTNSLPQPFQARNLTIANDYVGDTLQPEDPDKQTAVALLTQADKALFDNVRILGHRHALYVKSTAPNEVSRAYFRNCYLEGDEDMILGRGAAVLDQCRIHSLGDRVSGGAITAPSTRFDNPHGVLIVNSELTSDAGVRNVHLGHTWFEGNDVPAVGKTVIRNSVLGAHIHPTSVWAPTERRTPSDMTLSPRVLYTSDDYFVPGTGLIPPETYLAEFGNSGPGAAQ